MKKTILIIILVLCIFQMVVLATAIDVGGEAIDRGTATGNGWTFINLTNPANESGTITSIELWSAGEQTNVQVATFYLESGSNYSTRDWVLLGTISGGEHSVSNSNPITVDSESNPISLTIVAGDFIGIYYNGENMEHDLTGFSGCMRIHSDQIPCTDVEFALLAGDCSSFKGLGTTEGEAEDNAIFFGFNF